MVDNNSGSVDSGLSRLWIILMKYMSECTFMFSESLITFCFTYKVYVFLQPVLSVDLPGTMIVSVCK